jgi:hypothetical protein
MIILKMAYSSSKRNNHFILLYNNFLLSLAMEAREIL